MNDNTREAIQQFRDALDARGILIKGDVIADGQIHRTATTQKPREKDAAYCLHLDGVIPAGWLQNWRDGLGPEKWRFDKGSKYSAAEEAAYRKLMAGLKAKREAADAKRHGEARKSAEQIWAEARPAVEHPYLASKNITAHGVRVNGTRLVIPARDTAGTLHTLQYIDGAGAKLFLKDGAVRSHYLCVGELTDGAPLCICEGFATGASIHQATGYPVAVAFDCGNLEAVARSLKDKHPKLTFIVCADNDTETESNPGLTKGKETALAIDARLCFPEGVVDFNDLYVKSGPEAVKAVIAGADISPSRDQLDSYTVKGPGVNYSVSDKGVFCKDDDGDIFICSRLDVVAQARDIDSLAWGRLVFFRDADGNLHKWCLPMSMLATDGADMRRELMHQGLKIGSGNTARRRLTDYIQHATPELRARAVLKTGWESGGAYVLPGGVISDKGNDELVYLQTVNSAASRWYTEAGSLEDWRTHVAGKAPGNPRAILAISMSFAAPLVTLTQGESGGIHFHSSTTTGKTTTAIAAASVWGYPDERIQPWRATSNGLEGVAAAHNDSLLVLDEISQCDEREIGHTAYMLANGRGKTRSNRDATLKQSHIWKLLFLSTGEISMAEYLRQAGLKVNAGQMVRFVDLPAVSAEAKYGAFENVHGSEGATPGLKGQRFADELSLASKQYYGTAGKAFLREWIQGSHEAELNALRLDFKNKYTPEGSSPQVLRVMDRFALIAAAGELAARFGITGWKSGEAFEGVSKCASDWSAARGGVGGMEDRQLIETLTAFLESEAARFEPWHKGQYDRTPHNRAGYLHETDQTWFIFSNVFRKEICRGMDSTWAARLLHERGYLAERGRDQYSVNKRQNRVYAIRLPENPDWDEKNTGHTGQENGPVSMKANGGAGNTGHTGNTGQNAGEAFSGEFSEGKDSESSRSTNRPVIPVTPVSPNGGGGCSHTGQETGPVSPVFSELSADHQTLIGRAVDLINSELGEGSYSPESFFAAIPQEDRGRLTSKVIGVTQDRIRFGPGVDEWDT